MEKKTDIDFSPSLSGDTDCSFQKFQLMNRVFWSFVETPWDAGEALWRRNTS